MAELFDKKLILGKQQGIYTSKDVASICILSVGKIKSYRTNEDTEKGYTVHIAEFCNGGKCLFVFNGQELVSASLDNSVERRISDETPPRLVIL